MSLELTKEIWRELRRYVNTVDVADAAETLVAVLIDHDASADEIQAVFKSDSDVKRALVSYLKDQVADEDDDDEGLHDDDDDDDDY